MFSENNEDNIINIAKANKIKYDILRSVILLRVAFFINKIEAKRIVNKMTTRGPSIDKPLWYGL